MLKAKPMICPLPKQYHFQVFSSLSVTCNNKRFCGSSPDYPFPFFKYWVTLPWRSLILESHILDVALSNLIIVRYAEESSVCHYLRCKGFVTLHFIKISANNCIIIVVRLFLEVLLHTFWSLPWLPSFSTQLLFLYEYFSIVAILVS